MARTGNFGLWVWLHFQSHQKSWHSPWSNTHEVNERSLLWVSKSRLHVCFHACVSGRILSKICFRCNIPPLASLWATIFPSNHPKLLVFYPKNLTIAEQARFALAAPQVQNKLRAWPPAKNAAKQTVAQASTLAPVMQTAAQGLLLGGEKNHRMNRVQSLSPPRVNKRNYSHIKTF